MNIEQKTKFSKVAGLEALESRANSNLKELAKVLTVQEQIKANILSEISSLPSGGFKIRLEELVKSPGQMILVLNMLIEYHNLTSEEGTVNQSEEQLTEQTVELEEGTVNQTEEQITEQTVELEESKIE